MRSSVKMHCSSCKYAFLNMFVAPCCNCNEGSEFKPKTNADRIRAMTDEELAVWIAETSNCSDWCILNERCKSKPNNEACPNVWLDWLRKESGDSDV